MDRIKDLSDPALGAALQVANKSGLIGDKSVFSITVLPGEGGTKAPELLLNFKVNEEGDVETLKVPFKDIDDLVPYETISDQLREAIHLLGFPDAKTISGFHGAIAKLTSEIESYKLKLKDAENRISSVDEKDKEILHLKEALQAEKKTIQSFGERLGSYIKRDGPTPAYHTQASPHLFVAETTLFYLGGNAVPAGKVISLGDFGSGKYTEVCASLKVESFSVPIREYTDRDGKQKRSIISEGMSLIPDTTDPAALLAVSKPLSSYYGRRVTTLSRAGLGTTVPNARRVDSMLPVLPVYDALLEAINKGGKQALSPVAMYTDNKNCPLVTSRRGIKMEIHGGGEQTLYKVMFPLFHLVNIHKKKSPPSRKALDSFHNHLKRIYQKNRLFLAGSTVPASQAGVSDIPDDILWRISPMEFSGSANLTRAYLTKCEDLHMDQVMRRQAYAIQWLHTSRYTLSL